MIDLPAICDLGLTGKCALAVDVHRAGAAQAGAEAKFSAGELDILRSTHNSGIAGASVDAGLPFTTKLGHRFLLWRGAGDLAGLHARADHSFRGWR